MLTHTVVVCNNNNCYYNYNKNKNSNKIAKYNDLASMHSFYPVAIETGGIWSPGLLSLSRKLLAILVTGKLGEFTFLFQQLSIALQRENAVFFLNTFDSD